MTAGSAGSPENRPPGRPKGIMAESGGHGENICSSGGIIRDEIDSIIEQIEAADSADSSADPFFNDSNPEISDTRKQIPLEHGQGLGFALSSIDESVLRKKYKKFFFDNYNISLRTNRLCNKSLITLNGEIEYFRYVMRPETKEDCVKLKKLTDRTTITPLDDWLGLSYLPYKITPQAILKIAEIAAGQPSFKIAAEYIKKLLNINISDETIRCIVETIGAIVFDNDCEEAINLCNKYNSAELKFPKEKKNNVLYIKVDESLVRLQEKDALTSEISQSKKLADLAAAALPSRSADFNSKSGKSDIPQAENDNSVPKEAKNQTETGAGPFKPEIDSDFEAPGKVKKTRGPKKEFRPGPAKKSEAGAEKRVLKTEGDSEKNSGSEKKPQGWHENRLGTIFSSENMKLQKFAGPDCAGSSDDNITAADDNEQAVSHCKILRREYISYLGSIDIFQKLLFNTAVKNGYGTCQTAVLLSSGAAWIKDMRNNLFYDAVQILDFWHLCKHIYYFAKEYFKKDAEKFIPWTKKAIMAFKNSQSNEIMPEIEDMQKSVYAYGSKFNFLNYIINNIDTIDYAEYKKNGLYTGSVPIKNRNRPAVQEKLKRQGKTWRLKVFQPLMSLRSKLKSNLWHSDVELPVLKYFNRINLLTIFKIL